MTVSAKDQPAETTIADYSSEVRFGVVMYGGVSLAIYINGVANEMYEMACSTPKKGPVKGVSTSTGELYRRLSWLADNPSLREQYAELIKERDKKLEKPGDSAKEDVWGPISIGPEMRATRLVVDVISGTSAGGINGIFLAKALANGELFKPLADLWIEEGDINLLLNDDQSLQGLNGMHDRNRRLDSLLNGDRMYLKLFDAMQTMSSTEPHDRREPLVDELDLFVTTTDIIGTLVPLRLSGQIVLERRHKQNFHFRYSELATYNHFTAENNGLLAFAARCTSAFPFAFEPMTMERVKHLKPLLERQIDEEWPAYFSYLPAKEVMNNKHVRRPFGDGGYLDNKPFSYVAHVLSKRHAVIPVERKLVYVEPAPEEVDPDECPSADMPAPDAISNSIAALSGIPRYETIREDLQEVLKRNRTIERIDRIMSEGERDLRLAINVLRKGYEDPRVESIPNPFVRILKDTGGKVPPWPEFTREIMVRYYGTAILAYRRLRVSSATDNLGNRLAELWGVDTGSDHLYALAALVRTWRENHYKEKGEGTNQSGNANKFKTVNNFLDDFDVEYRIRKLGFLLRQIDHLRRLVQGRMKGELRPGELELLPQPDQWCIEFLGNMGLQLLDENLKQDSLENALKALHLLKTQLNDVQGKWRIFENKRGREFKNQNQISEELREQLNSVLEMLLGNPSEASLVLDTVSGGTTPVILDDATLTLVSRARTLQESVVERAKGLFKVAKDSKDPDRTKLQEKLESCLETLKLKRDGPNAYAILGCPELRLIERKEPKSAANATDSDEDDKVIVLVGPVNNSALDSPEGNALRRLLGGYFLYFDLFDQVSLPLYHDAGIGEPATVEVTRISPRDAINLVNEARENRRKLAGTALANFGAFIDRNWRLNDVMWGRLDGAERLIQAVLPMRDSASETVRKELTSLAQRKILQEALLPKASARLTELLFDALDNIPTEGDARQRVQQLLDVILPGKTEDQQREQLVTVLASQANEHALVNYIQQKRKVERETGPEKDMENISRAVTIIGCMLEKISRQKNKHTLTFRWIARGGLLFQRLVALSVPGTLAALWRAHLMTNLTIIAGIILIAAWFFGFGELLGMAAKTLTVIALLYLAFFVLGNITQSKGRTPRKSLWMIGIVVAALAAFGGVSLFDRLTSVASGMGGNTTNALASRQNGTEW